MAFNPTPDPNRRKIHIAGGSNENISNSTMKQAKRQPAYNYTKQYLSVADKVIDFNKAIPVKVRTVEGYTSDKETNGSFTLSNINDGHYIFTGRDGKVYLKTKPNFYLYRQGTDGINTGDISDNDTLILNLQSDNSLLLNESLYLQAKNIRTTNLQDISGVGGITIDSKINLLKDTTIANNKLTSSNETELSTKTTISGSLNLNAATILGSSAKIENSDKTLSIDSSNASVLSTDLKVTNNGIINNLYAGNGTNSSAPLEVISNKITLRQPTEISNTLNVNNAATLKNTLSVAERTTLTKGFDSKSDSSITGTLKVNYINIV